MEWMESWGSEAPVATGDGERQQTGQGQVTCCPRGERAGFSELDRVSSSLDGRAAGRGPPGDLCSPCEGGKGCGERRGQGGQEKCLRSRNNGLFSEVQPGLRDRLVAGGQSCLALSISSVASPSLAQPSGLCMALPGWGWGLLPQPYNHGLIPGCMGLPVAF